MLFLVALSLIVELVIESMDGWWSEGFYQCCNKVLYSIELLTRKPLIVTY